MRGRRRFDDEYKAKVALEALREEKTLQEYSGTFLAELRYDPFLALGV